MNHNLKYGLTLGLISVVFSLALLLIDYHLLSSSWIGIIPIVINIIVLLVAGFELRKLHGGYLSFREAFVSTLTIIAIGAAISMVYSMLVYNVFAPDIADALHQDMINNTASMLEQFGAEDEVIDQAVAQIEAGNPFSVGNLFLGYIYNLIGGLILALIIAAIVKKKKPDFE